MGSKRNTFSSYCGFDWESVICRFTWHTFEGNKHIPCLFRNQDPYVCIRMVENVVLGPLFEILPEDVIIAPKDSIKCYSITPAEKYAINKINSWHCDNYYGDKFTVHNDSVVKLADVVEFVKYLNFAHAALADPSFTESERCGFIRLKGKTKVPYVELAEGDKGVPWICIAKSYPILEEKVQEINGWDLAYLNVVCKIVGVKVDSATVTSSAANIVKVSDLQEHLQNAIVKKCEWPPKKTMLLAEPGNMSQGSSWSTEYPNKTFENYKKVKKFCPKEMCAN